MNLNEYEKIKVIEVALPIIDTEGHFVSDEHMLRSVMQQIHNEIPAFRRHLKEQLKDLFLNILCNKKIQAIKAFRTLSGLGLKESKDDVEDLAIMLDLPMNNMLVSRKIVDRIKKDVTTVTTELYEAPTNPF